MHENYISFIIDFTSTACERVCLEALSYIMSSLGNSQSMFAMLDFAHISGLGHRDNIYPATLLLEYDP